MGLLPSTNICSSQDSAPARGAPLASLWISASGQGGNNVRQLPTRHGTLGYRRQRTCTRNADGESHYIGPTDGAYAAGGYWLSPIHGEGQEPPPQRETPARRIPEDEPPGCP